MKYLILIFVLLLVSCNPEKDFPITAKFLYSKSIKFMAESSEMPPVVKEYLYGDTLSSKD